MSDFETLRLLFQRLGVKYSVATLPTGRVVLSVDDTNETEIQFCFAKEGDEVNNLVYFEAWRA